MKRMRAPSSLPHTYLARWQDLAHWAVDAQPKARENNRKGPIPMCSPSAAAGGTWPLYNTRKEGEAAWDLEGVLSRAVSRILWTRIEGKAFLVVCW